MRFFKIILSARDQPGHRAVRRTERGDEVGVQEATVEDRETDAATDELELPMSDPLQLGDARSSGAPG